MRYLVLAAAMAALPVAASAQESAADGDWGFFEQQNGTLLAGVAASDGSQLILQCEKKGKRSVNAVLVASKQLVAPSARDQMRSVWLQFDGGSVKETRWRYRDQMARTFDTTQDKTLTRLLEDLVTAEKLEVRLDPEVGRVEVEFAVKGTRAAAELVYESCKDEFPLD
jgi:hypothetical protein